MFGLGDRSVDQWLVGNGAVNLDAARSGQQNIRTGVINANGKLVRGESTEHNTMHGAQSRTGEHRDHRLRHHRHVDYDAIATPDSEPAKHAGATRHLFSELGIADALRDAGYRRVVNDSGLFAPPCANMAVQRQITCVQQSVGEPAKLSVFLRQYLSGGRVPVDQRRLVCPKMARLAARLKIVVMVGAIHGRVSLLSDQPRPYKPKGN